MKTIPTLIVFLSISLLLLGCQTPISPRQAFLLATKTKASDYSVLYEVSPESLKKANEHTVQFVRSVIDGVTNAIDQCPCNCPNLWQKLNTMETLVMKDHSNLLHQIEILKSEYDYRTDTILYFSSNTAQQEELGWAIMHGRKLKCKIIAEDSINRPLRIIK